MNKIGLLFTVVFWMIMAITNGQTSNSKMPEKMDLYLLIGQSNMAGRGLIDSNTTQEENAQVLMLTQNGAWVPAKHPLHFDKPKVAGIGPGLAFGLAMLENQKSTIGLIPCAVGGTSINKWIPGAYDSATKTHPFDDATIRLAKALESGTLKGIIWHQGESDSPIEKRKDYLAKLTSLIERWRAFVKNPNLPFVAGEIGYFNNEQISFNQLLDQLPSLVPNTAIASAAALKDKGDHLHFDGPSANELGKRYAAKMKELQKSIKKIP